MAPVAGMLKERGFHVTGSDVNVYPPASTLLDSLGIPWNEGFRAENLKPVPDLVVVGNVIARGNPELASELLKEAQDDVERQWRVYSARAAMPGRGETPNIAPPEKPSAKPEPVGAGGTQ